MSNYSDFQDAQKAYNKTTAETVKNFGAAVSNLNASIARIQSINRNLSSSDQGLIDDLQKQGAAIAAELNKIGAMNPPVVPQEVTVDKNKGQQAHQPGQDSTTFTKRDQPHEANKPFSPSSSNPSGVTSSGSQPQNLPDAKTQTPGQTNDPHNYQGNRNAPHNNPATDRPDVQPTNPSNNPFNNPTKDKS